VPLRALRPSVTSDKVLIDLRPRHHVLPSPNANPAGTGGSFPSEIPVDLKAADGRGSMDYPKLRPVDAFPIDRSGRELICLRDPTLVTDRPVQGFLAPHLDPHRGGSCFAWAYESIRQMTANQAVQQAATECAEPICYIVGGDLAHMGMTFGDQGELTPAFVEPVVRKDHALLAATARMDAEEFSQIIAEPQDRQRICGFSPTYTLLSTMPATTGTVLKYDQAVEPATQSMVSYVSVVFH
jgi:hypothetical protein